MMILHNNLLDNEYSNLGYISSFNLLQMGRVKQYKELCGYDKETGEVDEEVFENIDCFVYFYF